MPIDFSNINPSNISRNISINTDTLKIDKAISYLSTLDNQLRFTGMAADLVAASQFRPSSTEFINPITILRSLHDMTYSGTDNHVTETSDLLKNLKTQLMNLQNENVSLKDQLAARVQTPAPTPTPPVTAPVVIPPAPTTPIVNVNTAPAPQKQESNIGSIAIGLGLIGAIGYGAYWYFNKPGIGGLGNVFKENPLLSAKDRARIASERFDILSARHTKIISTIVNYAYGAGGDFVDVAETKAAAYYRVWERANRLNFRVASKAEQAVMMIEKAFSDVVDFGFSIGAPVT